MVSGLCFVRKYWFGVFFVQLCFVAGVAGQSNVQHANSYNSFNFSQSDRIVFVGNSLLEEAGNYGILEWMFMSAWPGKDLTFRNLGWSGDTADGKARSYISRPPEPYELLIQQIDTLDPALVVIGYGGVEAYEGESGVEEFGKNLGRLIADIDSLGAESIVLSTIPQVVGRDLPIDVTDRNTHLEIYSNRIREVADKYNKKYVDLYSVMSSLGNEAYTTDGIHLNGKGYFTMGERILGVLGYTLPEWELRIDAKEGKVGSSGGVEVFMNTIDRTEIDLNLQSKAHPVMVEGENVLKRRIIVEGLKKGIYNLSIDGEHVLACTSSDFTEGVVIRQGPAMDMARDIQTKYKEINDLYFWEYRPLNRTYLVGFRRYEQGQNSYELAVNSIFIDRLEEKIFQEKNRAPETLRITRIK